MEFKFEKTKHTFAELALLAVFAFGLLLAAILVATRNKIELTEPIKIPFDGISVKLPTGPNWHRYPQWKFSRPDNAFILEAVLKRTPRPEAKVSWQYYLAHEKSGIDRLIERISNQRNYTKVSRAETKIGSITFTILIFSSKLSAEDYYAVADLPSGRHIRLEVQTLADSRLAKRLFEEMLNNFSFKPDKRVDDGKQFVQSLKKTGAAELIEDVTNEKTNKAYLVKQTGSSFSNGSLNFTPGRYSGFLVDKFHIIEDSDSGKSLQAKSITWLSGKNNLSISALFDCDSSIEYFRWQLKKNSSQNRHTQKIEIEFANGTMRVYNLSMSNPYDNERQFSPAPSALPDIFIESIAARFLDYGTDEILIDLIFPEGTITPASIKKIPPKNSFAETGNTVSAVRFKLYDKPENLLEVYFDSSRNIIARAEKSEQLFKLETADLEKIYSEFEQSRSIIQNMIKRQPGEKLKKQQ